MYLCHRYEFSSISLKIFSSNLAINNILYGRAKVCFKFFSLKVKILFLRTTSASSTSAEVVTSFSCLKSYCLRRVEQLFILIIHGRNVFWRALFAGGFLINNWHCASCTLNINSVLEV